MSTLATGQNIVKKVVRKGGLISSLSMIEEVVYVSSMRTAEVYFNGLLELADLSKNRYLAGLD